MRRVVKVHDGDFMNIDVVNNGYNIGNNKYKVWSDEEVKTLRRLFYKDYSIHAIAKELNRLDESVENKITVLGMREDYYRDVVFPQEQCEWEHFFEIVDETPKCYRLLQKLGFEYTRSVFLKALEVAVLENIIDINGFNEIVLKFKLQKNPAYNFFKKNTLLSKVDII